MNKTTVVVAIALVAVVAVAGGVLLLNSNNDVQDTDYSANTKSNLKINAFPARLMVMGNANLDDYLDEKDVKHISNLVKKGNYDYHKEFMCDANYDGVIDQNDVDFVRTMINKTAKTVYYVNVDLTVKSFNMDTRSNNVITLIAPPLDTVLVLNKDLVKGFDNRITGKFKPEYKYAIDVDNLTDVGLAANPDKEKISNVAKKYNGELVIVCGTIANYGATMESDFSGTKIQVVRIPSWEKGGTIQGLLTLGFLLKEMDSAYKYLKWYDGVEKLVQDHVKKVPADKRPAAAAFYIYADDPQLLTPSYGEHLNLMKLGVKDITSEYMKLGGLSGDHGIKMTGENVATLVSKYGMTEFIGMVGTPFQEAGKTENIKERYNFYTNKMGTTFSKCNFVVCGYSFSTSASEPLNQLVLGKYLYPKEFADVDVSKYVNEYCKILGIDSGWSYENMNLLYCNNPEKDIMNRK